MSNMESRHLLNLSSKNALDYISEKCYLKNFPGGACARNALEKCAVRSPDERYRAHTATKYCISRQPLSQNPPSAPVIYGKLKDLKNTLYRKKAIQPKRFNRDGII